MSIFVLIIFAIVGELLAFGAGALYDEIANTTVAAPFMAAVGAIIIVAVAVCVLAYEHPILHSLACIGAFGGAVFIAMSGNPDIEWVMWGCLVVVAYGQSYPGWVGADGHEERLSVFEWDGFSFEEIEAHFNFVDDGIIGIIWHIVGYVVLPLAMFYSPEPSMLGFIIAGVWLGLRTIVNIGAVISDGLY